MKTPKLFMAIVAVLLFTNLAFGGNPNKKDFTENLANNMVAHLCKQIHLTDSQKLVIQAKAREYEVKMKKLSQEKDIEKNKTNKKQGIQDYRTALNNLLTKEQKDTLRLIRTDRIKTLSTIN